MTFLYNFLSGGLLADICIGGPEPSLIPVHIHAAIPSWIKPLSFGVVILASLMTFALLRKRRYQSRTSADRFAAVWLSIADRVLPSPPPMETELIRGLTNGSVLPWEDQTPYLKQVRNIVLKLDADSLYKGLIDELDQIAQEMKRSSSLWEQFYLPMELYTSCIQCLFIGCHDLAALDTYEKQSLFQDFFTHQEDIRNGLFRRISREYGAEFHSLNHGYVIDPQAPLTWEKERLSIGRPRKQERRRGRNGLL